MITIPTCIVTVQPIISKRLEERQELASVEMSAYAKLFNCRWKVYFNDKLMGSITHCKNRNVVVPLKKS